MNTKPIEELIKSGQYDKALAACNAEVEADATVLNEVLRLRSWIHTRQGNYLEGIQELEMIIQSGEASIADYHSAGLWSLHREDFAKAAQCFESAIDIGGKQGEVWYESSAHFYASFANMMLKKYKRAKELLENPEDADESMDFFIPNIGAFTRNDLLAEINKRSG